MVVAFGLTLVDPLDESDVNVPGVMEMLVAPLVDHLKVLTAPKLMLLGVTVKEPTVGFLTPITVTVTVAVVEPTELVAVRV